MTFVREIGIENMPIFQNIDFEKVVSDLKYKVNFEIPNNWDRQYEDKLQEKGIITYSDFFTARNYTLNCLIFNDIMELRGTTGS